jgi:hypothetical protein
MAYMYTIEYATEESSNEAEEILRQYKMIWVKVIIIMVDTTS